MTIELPEPTELLDLRGRPSGFDGYTAAQMRAYGEACAKAEREAIKDWCLDKAEHYRDTGSPEEAAGIDTVADYIADDRDRG
jgi:hypothetical protein